jgi:hypothetical protein
MGSCQVRIVTSGSESVNNSKLLVARNARIAFASGPDIPRTIAGQFDRDSRSVRVSHPEGHCRRLDPDSRHIDDNRRQGVDHNMSGDRSRHNHGPMVGMAPAAEPTVPGANHNGSPMAWPNPMSDTDMGRNHNLRTRAAAGQCRCPGQFTRERHQCHRDNYHRYPFLPHHRRTLSLISRQSAVSSKEPDGLALAVYLVEASGPAQVTHRGTRLWLASCRREKKEALSESVTPSAKASYRN